MQNFITPKILVSAAAKGCDPRAEEKIKEAEEAVRDALVFRLRVDFSLGRLRVALADGREHVCDVCIRWGGCRRI